MTNSISALSRSGGLNSPSRSRRLARAGRRDSELDNRSALFYNTAKLLTPKVLLAAEDAP